MIGYITLGSNDVAKAAEFYDTLFESIGGSRVFTRGDLYCVVYRGGQPMMGVLEPGMESRRM